MQAIQDLYENTKKTLQDEIEGLRLQNQMQIQEITNQTNQEKQIIENELAFANENKIQLQNAIQSLQDELNELTTVKTALETKLAEKETEIQTLRSENDKREDQIFWQLVNQVTTLKEQINQMNAQLKEFEERETQMSNNQISIEKIRETYDKQINELLKEKDEIVSKQQFIKNHESQEKNQNAELESQIESNSTILNQKLENEGQDEQQQMHNKNDNNSGELQDLLDYQIQINDKLNEKNQILEARLQELESHLTDKLQKSNTINQQIFDTYNQIQTEHKCLQDQYDQVKEEKNKLQIILNQHKENLIILQNQESDFPDAVQTTKNNFEQQKQENLTLQKDEQIINKNTFYTETSSLFSEERILPSNQEAQNPVTQINYSQPNIVKIEQLEEQLTLQAEQIKNLNELNQDLQSKIEQNSAFDIQNLKEQVIDAQFQADQKPIIDFTIQNDENQNKIFELQEELQQCKSTLEFKCNELEEMRITLETLKVQEQNLQDSLTLVGKKNSQYEERERQFKRAAEDMASKFKEKIKKEKEAIIQIQEQNSQLQEKIKTLEETNQLNKNYEEEIYQLKQVSDINYTKQKEYKIKLDNIMKEQLSLIEHLEGSNNFSVNMDHFKDQDSLNNMSSLKKHIDQNLSIFDTKIDALNQERENILLQILECLKNAGIDGIDDLNTWKGRSFDAVLEKLQILLQNYQEDQRQIKQLLQDNDNIQKENEEVKNQNYDLRYELQELNIKYEKLLEEFNTVQIQYQQFQKLFEETDNGKLSYQLKQIQEESRILKYDFIAKIESYEEVIRRLKDIDPQTANESQLKVQVSNEPKQTTSARISQGKYADLSINNDLQQEQDQKNYQKEQTQEEANETRIKPSTQQESFKSGQQQNKHYKMHAQPAALVRPQAPSSGGGLFTSIASFFLTESDVGTSLHKNHENRQGQQSQREETEYEYYEYDDEDENENIYESPVSMMKEEFYE